MALALTGDFDRYAQAVFTILKMAQMQDYGPNDDEELVEYIDELRLGILEAYTGISGVSLPLYYNM